MDQDNVTNGATGFNPYRNSQFAGLDLWRKAGMSDVAARDYLDAIKASLSSPNMVMDMRIPFNNRYQQVVLDDAIARFLSGEIDLTSTLKSIETQWNRITDEAGRPQQLRAYLSTIGGR